MLTNSISEDQRKSSVSDSNLVVSVMISTYPLANKGYLVSFFKDGPDCNFERYDLSSSMDFEASKLANFLEFNSVLLPEGCYYLPPTQLGDFIRFLSSGSSFFEMNLPTPSSLMQGLLLLKVNEDCFFDHEQEEED